MRDTDEANKRFCESSHTSVRVCCSHNWVLSTTKRRTLAKYIFKYFFAQS